MTAADKLRALCVGHPHAKIAWPHRELHEAADQMEVTLAALKLVRETVWPSAPMGGATDRLLATVDAAIAKAETP